MAPSSPSCSPSSTIALVVAYSCFFSGSLLLPLWLQRNLGYTPIWAGLATAPIGVLRDQLLRLLAQG